MYQAGLVLEGGGMKGIYTAGVLDFFLEKNIDFSSIYGVSAGAIHMCSYLSKQKGRATKGQSERTLTGSLVFIFLYPCSCVILGKLLNLSGPEAPHLEVNALVISTSSQCYCVKKTSVLSAPLSDSF